MGHAVDEGYGKTIQYHVEMWGEVLVAWATVNSHKKSKNGGRASREGKNATGEQRMCKMKYSR